jgi:hypothetical protein
VRRVGLLVLLCLVAAACGSGGDGDGEGAGGGGGGGSATVQGSVLTTEGEPATGIPVVLLPEDGVDAAQAPTCLGDTPLAACERGRRATTGPDGTYSVELNRAPGQYRLVAGVPDGPSVSASFPAGGGTVRVPPLRLWSATLDLTVRRGTTRGMWSQRDIGATEGLVFLTTDGRLLWTADGKGDVNLDSRVLEDAEGTVVIESTALVERGGVTFRVTHRSAGVPFRGTIGAPPSRQAACTPTPCALTDGDPLIPTNPPPSTREVTVDLAGSTPVSFIVVRACPRVCQVDTSVDGLAWRMVGSGDVPHFFVTPPVGPAVRYVRVRSTTELNGLAEVSVW